MSDIRTMWSIKSETSDTADVGNNSQHINFVDKKTRADDPVNMNASKGQPDGILVRSNEMVLTISYVKNEQSAEYEFQASSSEGNEGPHRQNLIATNAIKGESNEEFTNSSSGNVVDEESDTKEILKQDYVKGLDIHVHHTADILQHGMVATESDGINVGRKTSLATLKSNKWMKTKERHYTCGVCSYRTNRSDLLKAHKLTHSGEKPYKCDLCDYSTTSSRSLKAHKLIHTGEKPYKCDVCDYSSRQYGHLKLHKLIHSGEKPYKCDLCDYSATQYGNLKEHKIIHTGEKTSQV